MARTEREERLAAIRSIAKIDTEFQRSVVEFLLEEIDRLRDEAALEPLRARIAAFREAAQLLEDLEHDDDAVNLLRNVADGAAREHGVVPQPDKLVVEMTLDDAHELTAILMSDRYRMDKGDDRDVPQPRWGANVRVAKAVHAAIDARLAPKEN